MSFTETPTGCAPTSTEEGNLFQKDQHEEYDTRLQYSQHSSKHQFSIFLADLAKLE